MQHSYPSPLINQKPVVLAQLDKQVLPQASDPLVREKNGNWLAIIMVSVYFLSLWAPPNLPIPNLRWYMALGLAIFAFVLQKRSLNIQAASVYWIVFGLNFLGAVLSLLRAPLMDLALWNTIGLGISFVTYLLFIPVLATRLARRILLMLLIGTAILWTFEIQRLLREHTALYYSTFAETGSDKNFVGFGLSLACVAVFYLIMFWNPSKAFPKWQVFALRLILGLAGIYFFYNVSLIYARSGILTIFVGNGAVLGVFFFRKPRISSLLRIGGLIAIFAVFILLLLPRILAASPYWKAMFNRMQDEGMDAFSLREIVLQKGLFLIGENPFLGVGAGGSRAAVSSVYGDFPGYLIHNSILTDWAEKGILGLLSNVVWILMYLKILRRNLFNLPIIDQIWLIIFIPLFFEMNFFDMSSITMTMLAILAGINHEQYQMEQARAAPFLSKKIGA